VITWLRTGLTIFRAAILWVLLCAAGCSAWALDPAKPPGQNFALSHWKLQLPTSGGVLTGTGGSVDSVQPSGLVAGFTNDYFYTGPDGAMSFWVPDNGSTTSGSSHPRSELREQLIAGNDNTNWTVYGTHMLTAQCTVLQVASDTGKVCIGQIHEPNNKPDGSASAGNEHMIMFDLPNKKIYVNINLDGDQSSSFSKTLISGSSVALSNTIDYAMSVINGLLTISVNNVTNSWDLLSGTNYQGHIATNWDAASGNTVYFKAGDYNQTTDQCNCSTDGAVVAFYSLTLYHAACITNQPDSLAVIAGSNAIFSVGASGNGSLSYQWWFNGTNKLNGATAASLTRTNVTGTNAGDYTVVVSDSTSSFSSITSAVATLTVNFPPFITNQPASLAVTNGASAAFSIGADGTAPLRYSWRFNTTNLIAGATNSVLTVTNAQSTNAGSYTVVVTNAYGAVTSTVATLAVGPAIGPPARLGIVVQPAAALTAGTAANLATQPVVEVQDQSGLAVPGATNNVTVAVFSGVGTLSGTTTLTANGANARAAFTNLNLSSTQAGTVVLSFSAPGLSATNSQGLAVNPAPAVQVVFATQPGGATNGQPLAVQPVVQTADRFGNSSTVGLPGSLPVFLTNSTGTLTGRLTNDLGTNYLNGRWACTNLGFSGSLNTPHVLSAVVDPSSFGKAVLKYRWSFNGNLVEPYSGSNAVLVGGAEAYTAGNTRVSLDGVSTYVDLGKRLISGLSNVTVQVFAARTSGSTSPSNLTLVEFGGRNASGSGTGYLWLSHKIGSSGAVSGAQATTNWPGTTNFWASNAATLGTLQYGHLAVAFDPMRSYMRSWLTNTGVCPAVWSNGGWSLSTLNDTNCFVGRKSFDHSLGVTFSQIDVDEVRIWEGLLDDAAITNYVAAGADQPLLRNQNSASFTVRNAASVVTVPSQVTSLVLTGSQTLVGFSGVPAQAYNVRRSTNLTDWVVLLVTNVPSGGLFQIEDAFSDLGGMPAQAFYQLAAPVP
jgi:Alginate lyase/Immunoglobulin domain